MKQLKIIGLTGNIGSGKSSVSEIFLELGGLIIDCDKISKEVVKPFTPAYFEILNRFGDICNPDKTINRALLAEIVFKDKDELAALNNIIHKQVTLEVMKRIENARKNPDGAKFIVVDAPLLIEAGLDKICDEVIVLTALREVKIQRVMQRDGLSREQVLSRMSYQLDDETLKKSATIVIENNGSLDELRERVLEIGRCRVEKC